MVRGPAATSRLRADPAQEPRLRYLAKGTGNDHSDMLIPAEHQDFDYMEWIARVPTHIPEPGPLTFCATREVVRLLSEGKIAMDQEDFEVTDLSAGSSR